VTQRATGQMFIDVPPSAYYFDAVNLMAAQHITSGCAPDYYCPLSQVTRAQMAVFIVRAVMGGDDFTCTAGPYFDDTPSTAFGFQCIQKFKDLLITTGCGTRLFCPASPVTRDQMAVFIIRARYGAAAAFDFPGTAYFSDVPSGAFAFEYIQRMKEDNITNGCSASDYCPSVPQPLSILVITQALPINEEAVLPNGLVIQ
jgi:hypothetical protein